MNWSKHTSAARWQIRRQSSAEELRLARSPARKQEKYARVIEIMLDWQARNPS